MHWHPVSKALHTLSVLSHSALTSSWPNRTCPGLLQVYFGPSHEATFGCFFPPTSNVGKPNAVVSQRAFLLSTQGALHLEQTVSHFSDVLVPPQPLSGLAYLRLQPHAGFVNVGISKFCPHSSSRLPKTVSFQAPCTSAARERFCQAKREHHHKVGWVDRQVGRLVGRQTGRQVGR